LEDQSVTAWLRQLRRGDQKAARQLWLRYGPQLTTLVRKRFRRVVDAVADEEDVVQSVFRALWTGAAAGRFDQVQDRNELWWLLLTITRRKALNRRAYNARQRRKKSTLSIDAGHSEPGQSSFSRDLADPNQPPPDLIFALDEQQRLLLALLPDDTLRSIAVWKLEGYTHDEIATKLGVTPRTVVRKMNLVRARWQRELIG
jgi:RNA polymerase sigma factor (sigma-70 family)